MRWYGNRQCIILLNLNLLAQILKGYAVIIVHLLLGVLILIGTQKLKLPLWLNSSAFTLILFLLINIADEILLRPDEPIKEYWSIRKIHYLFVGALAGILIGIIPEILSLLTGNSRMDDIKLTRNFSVISILLMLVVAGWEELWFRGLYLNFCRKYLSPVHISLVTGLLFMLVHTLNPEINLAQSGPTLFFAGALLTLLYFHFQNIWLPLGIHFGNNYLGTIMDTSSNGLFFGNEGYINAMVLATLYLYFIFMMHKKVFPN